MRKKYYYTFDIVKTEAAARALCDQINASHTAYMRKKHPAHYTPWDASDGSFSGYVVLYYR